MIRPMLVIIGLLFITLGTAAAVPTTEPASNAAPVAEQITAKISDLEQKLAAMPPGSPERAAAAGELVRLRQLLHAASAESGAVTPAHTSSAVGLPPEVYSEWQKQNIQPIRDRIRQYRLTGTQAREARAEIEAKEKELAGWTANMKVKFPNGADRCTTCNGSGKVQNGSTYVPPVQLDSGRVMGGVRVANTARCPICSGDGWVAKPAANAAQAVPAGNAKTNSNMVDVRCPQCGGAGRMYTHVMLGTGQSARQDLGPCRECRGTGMIRVAATTDTPGAQAVSTSDNHLVPSTELLHPTDSPAVVAKRPALSGGATFVPPVTAADIAARRQQLLAPIDAAIRTSRQLLDQMPAEAKGREGGVSARLEKLNAERARIVEMSDDAVAAPLRAEREKKAVDAARARREADAKAEQLRQWDNVPDQVIDGKTITGASIQSWRQQKLAKLTTQVGALQKMHDAKKITDDFFKQHLARREASRAEIEKMEIKDVALQIAAEQSQHASSTSTERRRAINSANNDGPLLGQGTDSGAGVKECPTCHGKGLILVFFRGGGGHSAIAEKMGTSDVEKYDTCPTCNGTGQVAK